MPRQKHKLMTKKAAKSKSVAMKAVESMNELLKEA